MRRSKFRVLVILSFAVLLAAMTSPRVIALECDWVIVGYYWDENTQNWEPIWEYQCWEDPPPPPTDSDGDGVPDGSDNCPGTYNPDQSDSDGNGIGDACDAPPPPTDSDGDGVPDGWDNCPSTYNPDQADSDGNGIGDACDAPPPPPPPQCYYAVSPSGATVGPENGVISFEVWTNDGACGWSASGASNFLYLIDSSGGVGPGWVTYGIENYTAYDEPRYASLEIAGQVVSVEQLPQSGAPCSYSVSPPSATVAYTNGSISFSITTADGCAWTTATASDFLYLTSPSSGSGSATVTYGIENNTGPEPRYTQFNIAGQPIGVTQNGGQTPGGTPRRVPYFGYYFILDEFAGGGLLNYIDEVSGYANFAQLQYKRTYSPSEGQQLANAGISLFVELGINRDLMNDLSLLEAYLDNVQAGLVNANMWSLVAAVAPGEEWYIRVFDPNDAGGWAEFVGITAESHGDCSSGPQACWVVARRDLMRDKLNAVIATIKNRWNKPVMLVENRWSDTYNLFNAGPDFYFPVPSNLDILGMDPYIDSTGYSGDCGSGMQQKFYDQVGRFYDHALASYSHPIVMVGQAFNSGGWVMPSTCQMNWWYEIAQSSSRFAGLVWFTYGSPTPVVSPVRDYPEQLDWLRNTYLYNQSLP